MMFYQVLFVVTFFYSCSGLVCTMGCAFVNNISTSFSIPDRCGRLILAGKCTGNIAFWYDQGVYQVFLRADQSSDIDVENNNRYVFLDLSRIVLTSFSYSINRECNNRDDCARQLITDIANEMLQRDYNTSLLNEIVPLITDSPLTPQDSNLQCYDANQTVQICGASPQTSSCVIKNAIIQKKTSFTCETELYVGNAYVAIYQSAANDASFDIHCNRSLCNTRSNMEAVKEITFKYNITVTPDGKLDHGSKLMTSVSLIIIMVFLLFSYHF